MANKRWNEIYSKTTPRRRSAWASLPKVQAAVLLEALRPHRSLGGHVGLCRWRKRLRRGGRGRLGSRDGRGRIQPPRPAMCPPAGPARRPRNRPALAWNWASAHPTSPSPLPRQRFRTALSNAMSQWCRTQAGAVSVSKHSISLKSVPFACVFCGRDTARQSAEIYTGHATQRAPDQTHCSS